MRNTGVQRRETHLLQLVVPGPPRAPSSLRTPLLAPPRRLGGRRLPLLRLAGTLLREALHLRHELGGQLDVLGRVLPDAVRGHPVVPGGLPALVVDLELMARVETLGRGLHVEDLGLVEHFVVEAEDLFVLYVGLRRLFGSHGRRSSVEMASGPAGSRWAYKRFLVLSWFVRGSLMFCFAGGGRPE